MSLTVHHLNTATFCTGSRRTINGAGRWFNPLDWLRKGRMVCHCLLLETREGLVLVDTGFGVEDMIGRQLGLKLNRRALGLTGDATECALHQLHALGYQPDDVRHIILTHLDPDHAGGIKDFPRAQVHVHRKEWEAAIAPQSPSEWYRYQQRHWAHAPAWVTHREEGERWHGFEAVRPLTEAVPEVLLIPLAGHSRGHCGVAVDTTEGWLLHCGDAYFNRQEIEGSRSHRPVGVAAIEAMTETDRNQRLQNLERLRALNGQGDVRLICSHDPDEYEACCPAHH